MAEKDISEKILEDHADVFADIVNGFCFQGREVVKPDELEPMNLRSAYRAEAELHDVERDVAKRWKKGGRRNMCDVIDRYINMGEEKGKALGRQETLKEVINNLRAYGNTDEKIADMLKLSFSQVQQIPRT